MPYITQWVDPELFIEHNGVCIYHTYKENEVDNGVLKYSFTPCKDDNVDFVFDVRLIDDNKKLKNHPPCILPTDSAEEKRCKTALWEKWREEEPEIIKQIIIENINLKKILLP